jgi:hypothetical protein
MVVPDERVTPLLDVTDRAQIQEAADGVEFAQVEPSKAFSAAIRNHPRSARVDNHASRRSHRLTSHCDTCHGHLTKEHAAS